MDSMITALQKMELYKKQQENTTTKHTNESNANRRPNQNARSMGARVAHQVRDVLPTIPRAGGLVAE